MNRLSTLGAAGSVVTFITLHDTVVQSFDIAGGCRYGGSFVGSSLTDANDVLGNIPFLKKDVVLLAASIYLLKQGITTCASYSNHFLYPKNKNMITIDTRANWRSRSFVRRSDSVKIFMSEFIVFPLLTGPT
jgi:hypothetical protein